MAFDVRLDVGILSVDHLVIFVCGTRVTMMIEKTSSDTTLW
jgi:hypothetical protein